MIFPGAQSRRANKISGLTRDILVGDPGKTSRLSETILPRPVFCIYTESIPGRVPVLSVAVDLPQTKFRDSCVNFASPPCTAILIGISQLSTGVPSPL